MTLIGRHALAAAALAAISVAATPALSAPTEGRWFRECGKDLFCRIYVKNAGKGRFGFHFMTTSPSSPDSCEWTAVLDRRKDGKLEARGKDGGFVVSIGKDGLLRTSGRMPSACGERPATDVFSPDDADENGDI